MFMNISDEAYKTSGVIRKGSKKNYYLFIVVVLGVFALAFIYLKSSSTVCDRTLKYGLGVFDDRFGIGKEEYLRAIKLAEQVWEDSMELDLLEYDSGASFKINLVFSEEQAATNETRRLKEELSNLESLRDKIVSQYNSLSLTYDKKLKSYNDLVISYQKSLDSYNSRVNFWNSRGGAPRSTYSELESERKYLENFAAEIEQRKIELDGLAKQINNLANEGNRLADKADNRIITYRNKYGGEKEFDKGEYVENREVNIYQFDGIDDLVLILAHEFGHSLGLEHVQNSSSIMYYLMGEQNLEPIQLTKEDQLALKEECRLK